MQYKFKKFGNSVLYFEIWLANLQIINTPHFK